MSNCSLDIDWVLTVVVISMHFFLSIHSDAFDVDVTI